MSLELLLFMIPSSQASYGQQHGPINLGLGTKLWARGGRFLGGQSLIGVV